MNKHALFEHFYYMTPLPFAGPAPLTPLKPFKGQAGLPGSPFHHIHPARLSLFSHEIFSVDMAWEQPLTPHHHPPAHPPWKWHALFCPSLSTSPRPFWASQKGESGVFTVSFPDAFVVSFGPDEFIFISLFSACLLRLLNLVSVCDLLPLVSLLIRQTQGYLRRREQCKKNKYTLAFKLSVDNWNVLSLWMIHKIIYKKETATVCFILRTEWHHHVVTSLHARACSFLLFGLWGCFEVNVEKIMKCLKLTCCGLVFLVE